MCPRAPALRGRGHRIRVPAPRQPTRGPGDAERHRLGYDRTAVSSDARHVAGPICPERPPAARPRPRLPRAPDLGLSKALMPVHLGGHAPIRPAYRWAPDLTDHPRSRVLLILSKGVVAFGTTMEHYINMLRYREASCRELDAKPNC